MGVEAPDISDEALAVLAAHSFPGNVRELENVLERALTLCITDTIEAGDIQVRAPVLDGPTVATTSAGSSDHSSNHGSPGSDEAGATVGGGALGDQLDSIERDAIVKALEQTRYNKTAAAKLLGMSFRALRYRIKKLGIE
jgi:two-component system response regulator PilR (NtrC family)